MRYTREYLIDLCERAIVDETKWSNRDTSGAQIQVGQAWALLKAECNYKVLEEGNGILNVLIEYRGFAYFDYDVGVYDQEFFYIPTDDELDRCNGEDWY